MKWILLLILLTGCSYLTPPPTPTPHPRTRLDPPTSEANDPNSYFASLTQVVKQVEYNHARLLRQAQAGDIPAARQTLDRNRALYQRLYQIKANPTQLPVKLWAYDYIRCVNLADDLWISQLQTGDIQARQPDQCQRHLDKVQTSVKDSSTIY